MKLRILLSTTALILGLAIPFSYNSCAPIDATKTGNPGTGETKIMVASFTGLTSLTLCIKRLRFVVDSDSDGGDDGDESSLDTEIDFLLGETAISPSGTELSRVEIP